MYVTFFRFDMILACPRLIWFASSRSARKLRRGAGQSRGRGRGRGGGRATHEGASSSKSKPVKVGRGRGGSQAKQSKSEKPQPKRKAKASDEQEVPATPSRPPKALEGSPETATKNKFLTKTAKKRKAAKEKRASAPQEALEFLRSQQNRLHGLPMPSADFNKQSFTCPAPAHGEKGALNAESPSSIGVVLSSKSFYVSRARVPPELSTIIQACKGDSYGVV